MPDLASAGPIAAGAAACHADRPRRSRPASRHDPHDRAARRRRRHPPRHRRSPADAAGQRRHRDGAPLPRRHLGCRRRRSDPRETARLAADLRGRARLRSGRPRARSRAAARRAGGVARRRLPGACAGGAADAGHPRSARRGAPLYRADVDARGGARVDPGASGAGPAAVWRRRGSAAGRRAVPADRWRSLAAARRVPRPRRSGWPWPASRPTHPNRCCWPCCAATASLPTCWKSSPRCPTSSSARRCRSRTRT